MLTPGGLLGAQPLEPDGLGAGLVGNGDGRSGRGEFQAQSASQDGLLVPQFEGKDLPRHRTGADGQILGIQVQCAGRGFRQVEGHLPFDHPP